MVVQCEHSVSCAVQQDLASVQLPLTHNDVMKKSSYSYLVRT